MSAFVSLVYRAIDRSTDRHRLCRSIAAPLLHLVGGGASPPPSTPSTSFHLLLDAFVQLFVSFRFVHVFPRATRGSVVRFLSLGIDVSVGETCVAIAIAIAERCRVVSHGDRYRSERPPHTREEHTSLSAQCPLPLQLQLRRRLWLKLLHLPLGYHGSSGGMCVCHFRFISQCVPCVSSLNGGGGGDRVRVADGCWLGCTCCVVWRLMSWCCTAGRYRVSPTVCPSCGMQRSTCHHLSLRPTPPLNRPRQSPRSASRSRSPHHRLLLDAIRCLHSQLTPHPLYIPSFSMRLSSSFPNAITIPVTVTVTVCVLFTVRTVSAIVLWPLAAGCWVCALYYPTPLTPSPPLSCLSRRPFRMVPSASLSIVCVLSLWFWFWFWFCDCSALFSSVLFCG